METITSTGSESSWEYSYGSDGNLVLMKNYIAGIYHVLQDSIIVHDHSTEAYAKNNVAGYNKIVAIYNDNIYTGQPTVCNVSITLGQEAEQTNYWTYTFSYDNKNRISKVKQQIKNVVNGGFELSIEYTNDDNVSSLTYTGLDGLNKNVIPSTGYDHQQNVYSAMKYWKLICPFGWNTSDPEPIFNALSKNNLLGYTSGLWTRSISCAYNSDDFPISKQNTNSTSSGTATIQQVYTYECQ